MVLYDWTWNRLRDVQYSLSPLFHCRQHYSLIKGLLFRLCFHLFQHRSCLLSIDLEALSPPLYPIPSQRRKGEPHPCPCAALLHTDEAFAVYVLHWRRNGCLYCQHCVVWSVSPHCGSPCPFPPPIDQQSLSQLQLHPISPTLPCISWEKAVSFICCLIVRAPWVTAPPPVPSPAHITHCGSSTWVYSTAQVVLWFITKP